MSKNLDAGPFDAVLVVAANRRLGRLIRAQRQGARIVHRLDGYNWRVGIDDMPVGVRARAMALNGLMRIIRRGLADAVIYQSDFVRQWWTEAFGSTSAREIVIRNGVDLDDYPCPQPYETRDRLLCVEGTVQEDASTVETLLAVHRRLLKSGCIRGTVLSGRLSERLRARFEDAGIEVLGAVAPEQIRTLQARARLFLSLEVNPACPNSVIEALASGTPVVGFDTGSLRELIEPGAGTTVPYGGDPWRLQVPDNLEELADVATRVCQDAKKIGARARALAEERYDMKVVADAYLEQMLIS